MPSEFPLYDPEQLSNVVGKYSSGGQDGISLDQPQAVERTILDEAAELTSKERQVEYGHPRDDFDRTAKMWGAILGTEVTADQVAMCMIAIKLSRLCNAKKRDSIVDIAGYARTMEMLDEIQ